MNRALASILALVLVFPAIAQAQVTPPSRGGTGTSTAPSYGQLLVGNGSGGYTLTATSSLGISAGAADGTFSTTSADYWMTLNNFFSTTSALYLFTVTDLFSTTSADHWKTQNNFFSTTSTDHWKSLTSFFSTTSADHWKTQNNFFSTTSADAWKLTNNFYSTTSANHWATFGLAFSTTSSNYWEAQQAARGFSTTSANAWSALGLGFSTTSANLWRSLGLSFSTTSANAWSLVGLGFSTTSSNYWKTQNTFEALTAGDGITRTADDFDCDTATASALGCLSAANWSVFNNKVSSTSIDTIGEVETLWGVSNILVENDIDASSELAAIMDDETGTGGALVFASGPTFTGVTTLANASTTILSGSTFCIGTDCRQTWPSGGGGGGLATATAMVDNQIVVGTSADDVGSYSTFTFNDVTKQLTVQGTTTVNALQAGSTAIGTNVLKLSPLTGLTPSNSESAGGLGSCATGAIDATCFTFYRDTTGSSRNVSIIDDNAAFTGNTLHLRNDGTGTTLNIICTQPQGLGCIKTRIDYGADADSSLFSGQIDDNDAQGLFLLAPPGHTGKLLNLRIASTTEALTMLGSNGYLGLGSSTPYARLSVVGQVVASHFTGTTTSINTFPNLLATNATTTSFGINSETFTDLTGTGLQNTSGALQTTLGTAIDISAETNLTAGDALTLTDDDIDFDGGASPGGILGGTWASPTLDDNFLLNTGDTGSGSYFLSFATTSQLTIGSGSTGIYFTDDADGALTIQGIGNSNNESFTINLDDTADIGVYSSATGLVAFDYPNIRNRMDGLVIDGDGTFPASSDGSILIGDGSDTGTFEVEDAPVCIGDGGCTPNSPDGSLLALFASTTALSTDYASSTVYYGAGLADCNTGNMLTWTAGRFGCEDDTEGVGGSGFSTTSSNYWAAQGLAFSTTSSNHWASFGLGFSTTSANTWSSFGLGFSSTSADVWGASKGYATFGYPFPAAATSTLLTMSGGINLSTGTLDVGGGILEIPNGTGNTADDPGEIAHDTSGDQLIVDNFVMGSRTQKLFSLTVASTSRAFIDGGLLPIPLNVDGYTITAIRCYVVGGTSKVIAIEDASANSSEDVTCATTATSDDGSITNATYTAAELSNVDFGATTGAVNYVTIAAFGELTRE